MTWQEIRQSFPDEWVALTDYRSTSAIDVSGTIIVHHGDKKKFYKALSQIRSQYPNIAVRYTGWPLVKNPEIPLLWQITDTK